MRPIAAIVAMILLTASYAASAGEIAGTVYGPDGKPVGDVELSVSDQTAVSAANGFYRFTDVSEGERLIQVGPQRIAVEVTELGTVQRNIFLLSRTARLRAIGEVGDPEGYVSLFGEALELAGSLISDNAASNEIAWRWNDHEG